MSYQATASMARALATHREWYREFLGAKPDDVAVLHVGNQCVTVRGSWISVERVRHAMERHLSVDVYMSDEAAPGSDVYHLSAFPGDRPATYIVSQEAP